MEPAEVAEQKGMAAVVEAPGSMWDFSDWPDQFGRLPQKKQQFLSMNPVEFAETRRSWARSLTAGGRRYFAGLTDGRLTNEELL